MKKKNLGNLLLVIIFSLLVTTSIYYSLTYTITNFENIFATIFANNKGTSLKVVFDIIKSALPIFLLVFFISYLLLRKSDKINGKFENIFGTDSKLYKVRMLLFNNANKILAILIIIAIVVLGFVFNFYSYLYNNIFDTEIYEDEYVNPASVEITFPEKKKNLIHIYLESMETSVFSKENGGDFDKTITPELEELAKEGINFSASETLGGFMQTPGATWTQGAMITQESGMHFKTIYTSHKDFDPALPNLVTMGDILKDNDYNLEILMGSDGDFHDRKVFYEKHGYEVYDYYKAIENEIIDEDYKVFWGFEDEKLFSLAKDEITKLAKKDEPFAFKLLTVDTHFIDGYTDDSCELPYDKAYYNSYHCSSKKVGEFVKWIKTQDFYEDTVIVITGDHISMQEAAFDENNRHVYNTFINTDKTDEHSKNRQATTFDIFPSILSSMDVEIEGNRLGLGVDLFSGQKTLAETYGYDKFTIELERKSKDYLDLTQINR
ncbi:LTA synthase family protein [uncultured Helcococcus sp.]|uniref:LTA synthase family protein n=1 Tax=uncultured Helcococcus sp. TaxID=1072508 RepID=UPI00288A7C90|nr:LTA synthase family protein [uncultured Helcococcus sp.]